MSNAKENPLGIPQTFKVTTTGRSGEDSLTILQDQNIRVGPYARGLLKSKEYVVNEGATYTLELIRIDDENNARTNKSIMEETQSRGLLPPPAEVSPIVREMFSDEDLNEMGLWGLIIMHEPITDPYGNPLMFGLYRENGISQFWAFSGHPDIKVKSGMGCLFLVPEKT